MNKISANHMEQTAQKMYASQERFTTFMDNSDPADPESWEKVCELGVDVQGATFAAQQEFKLEHFLAKNLISSI